MKLYDKATRDLAQAVQDVLEGKVKKEEVKYPHDMFHPETGEKEVANNEDEHNALSKKGYTHDKPKENVAGPADLSVNQNVKKVQDKHGPAKKLKGPGVVEDVEAAHEEALAIEEARQLKDPKKEVMVVKKGKVEVIDKKDLKKYMKMGYGLAEEDEEEVKEAEMSAKQAAYKKVFDGALKKFGVKSPAELEGDKKKEFFDYVDSQYDAGENETDVDEGVGDFFNKAKKKVQKGIDKVAGTDLTGDKAKIKKAEDEMRELEKKEDDIQAAIRRVEQDNKDGKISDEKADNTIAYHQERQANNDKKQQEVKARLQKLKAYKSSGNRARDLD